MFFSSTADQFGSKLEAFLKRLSGVGLFFSALPGIFMNVLIKLEVADCCLKFSKNIPTLKESKHL